MKRGAHAAAARRRLPLPATRRPARALVGPWARLAPAAARIRREVFFREMGVPADLVLDGSDADAIHLVLYRGRRAIGTGRLLPGQAQIGRVAVMSPYRHQGFGNEIVIRLMREAVRLGLGEVRLHAQAHAVEFYRRLGYRPEGRLFHEAGIPHRRMRRTLAWRDAAAAVIAGKGRFLLGRRAPGLLMGGRWDLFGGKLEPGESAPAALRRELKEELSIRARIGPQIAVSLYDDPRDGGLFRCPVHAVTSWTGSILLNPEHTLTRWFTLRGVAHLALAHPDIPRLCAIAQRLPRTRPRPAGRGVSN